MSQVFVIRFHSKTPDMEKRVTIVVTSAQVSLESLKSLFFHFRFHFWGFVRFGFEPSMESSSKNLSRHRCKHAQVKSNGGLHPFLKQQYVLKFI